MSWHYSRALAEEYSAATCSDGKQSAQLSANHTPQAYLCSDRMTAFSRLSRFGMTFAPLTENLGADLLTWFLADSRVRTYQQPGMVPESMASAPACGAKWIDREYYAVMHDGCEIPASRRRVKQIALELQSIA